MHFNYFRKKIRSTLALMTAMLSFSLNVNSREVGEPGKVALQVSALQQEKTNFVTTSIFNLATSQQNANVESTIRNYTLISVNHSALTTLLQTKPEFIRVSIPVRNSNAITVLLYRESISGNGFTLLTSDGLRYNELNTVVHYRGRMENDINSIAAFSFSNEEIMGMVANDHGNFVFGELANSNENEYVFYNDRDLVPPFIFECGTNTNNPVRDYQQQQNGNPTTLSVNCVDWYYEIDYDIYLDKDSLAGVNSYIQGVFNQVSTLYDNDGISITLQTLFVWTAVDPYTGPSTSNYLTQIGRAHV